MSTLQHLSNESHSGYFADELRQLLGVSVKGSLLRLVASGQVSREKVANRYLYCSMQSAIRKQQLVSRNLMDLSEQELSDEAKAAIIIFLSMLDEKQRRLYAGVEAIKYGVGGDQWIASLLGMHPQTVARGRRDLLAGDVEVEQSAQGRRRSQAGGKKTPEIIAKIETLMEYETAGDPITGLKWTRRTTEKIARELAHLGGIEVSANTVGRILKELGYCLRVNHKKISSGTGPDRDAQFKKISAIRGRFSRRGLPVISVDTKKKELVGNFKNPGAAWNKQAVAVKDHDFRSQGLGLAVPYGIYDIQANRGSVFVGTSHDTPQFAVSSIEKWWRYDGRRRYDQSKRISSFWRTAAAATAIAADAWKHQLQQFSNRHRIKVTVSHYPPGTSKVEPYRTQTVQRNQQKLGRLAHLHSFATIQNYIRTTSTTTGLAVKAYIDSKIYAPKASR